MNRPPDFPPAIRAALFDFDETMIDLEQQHDIAHHMLCRAMGADYDRMPESFRFGSGRRIVDDISEMRRFFAWTRSEAELYAERHRYFLAACREANLALLPGVERAARALHGRGLRLAVTTSADAGAVEEILERFGIRQLFATIVGGDEVAIGKPDPAAYRITAAKIGVPPGACIVFEDSHAGVVAARRAGMYCVAVRNPRARQLQDLSSANTILESFLEFDADWIRAIRPAVSS